MVEINNLHKLLVRVNNGSGICLKFEKEKKCYVLTAYHCIKDSINNSEDIGLFNDERKSYSIISEPLYNEKKDIALIEIEFIEDMLSIPFEEKSILPDDEITFIGYPNRATNNERKRLNGEIVEWNNKTSINIYESIQGSFIEKEKTIEVLTGFSGSGVFKKNGQKLTLIGLLISLPEENLEYKEVSCVSIKEIKLFLEKNNIISLSFLHSITNLRKEKFLLDDGNYFEIEMVRVDLPDKSLYVSIYPITFEEYDLFCDEKRNGERKSAYLINEQRRLFPIVNVVFKDALDFCAWLNEKNKDKIKQYTLLSSNEWKIVAEKNKSEFNIDYNQNSFSCIGTNLGKKGIFDMLGNIQEICRDKYIVGGFFKDIDRIIENKESIVTLPRKEVGFRVIQVDISK